jgi:hypothetical protein
MTAKKRKRIALSSIVLVLTSGIAAAIYLHMQSQSLVERELDSLTYDGWEVLQPFTFVKSHDNYYGQWISNDSIDTVSEHYEQMGFIFYIYQDENDYEMITPKAQLRDGVYTHIRLYDVGGKTAIMLTIGKELTLREIWNVIIY